MPVFYGDKLTFSGYPGVGEFQIDTNVTLPEFYLSGSKGGKVRPAGAKLWQGRALFLTPISLKPGDRVQVVAAMDTSAKALTGTAFVTGLTIRCDAAERGLVSWEVEFAGDGPLQIGGAGAHPQAPRIPVVVNPSVTIEGAGSPPLRAWALRMAVNPKRYLAAGNDGWVKHVVGGFDASIRIVTLGDDVLYLDPGRFFSVTASDGAGNTYTLKWMRPTEQNVVVDPNQEMPPGTMFTLVFSAVNAQGTYGECIANGARVWPTY